MTTRATDGTTRAAHTLANGHFARQDPYTKIFEHDGCWYATSGSITLAAQFKLILDPEENQEKLNIIGDGGLQVVRVNRTTGEIHTAYECLTWVERKPPFALGSGAQFAMGALLQGATPEEAVAIAGKLDVYTGGEPRVVDVHMAEVELKCLNCRAQHCCQVKIDPHGGCLNFIPNYLTHGD